MSRAHPHPEYPIYWSVDRFGVRQRVWPDENGRWDCPVVLEVDRGDGILRLTDAAAVQHLEEINDLMASSWWWRFLGLLERWFWPLGWNPQETAYGRRRWREKLDRVRVPDPRVGVGFAFRYLVSRDWAIRYGEPRRREQDLNNPPD